MSRFSLTLCATGLLVLASINRTAVAQFVLADQNSFINVNPSAEALFSSWNVDGVNHLNEMSNWYRIGSTGGEKSAHTLALQSATPFDSNGDFIDDSATLVYTQARFRLELDVGVTGFAPGSRKSKMGETISITNTSTTPLIIHFFEYMDLNLTNFAGDDSVVQLTPSSGVQSDAFTKVSAGIIDADGFELANFPFTLTNLLDSSPTTLSNNPGFGNTWGPADVTWALQWNFDGVNPLRPIIQPGQTAVIIKDWIMTPNDPEPGTLGIVTLVGGALLRRRERRRN